MGIQFDCQCGKHYRVSDKYAGQPAECRHCGADLRIPAATIAAPPIEENEPNEASPVPKPPVPKPPVLEPTGKKPALPSRTIFSEIKKLPNTELVSSECYTVAGQPNVQIFAGFGGQLVNTNPSEHDISRLEVFHLRDRLGDYAVLQSYDGSGPLPVEYVAWMQGCLPAPLVLLKTSGDRSLEVGSAIAGPLGVLLAQASSKVQCVWAATDGSQPPIAMAAQQNPILSTNIHWDGEFKMGPLSVTHHLRWGAQAIPLDDDNYLLVAASVPRKKLIGLRFDLPWFGQYRTEFANVVNAQRATECGEFNYVDPGVWLLGTTEALQWVDLD